MDPTELLDFLVGGTLWGFLGTMIGFDIYNLVPAFNWIFDFVLIEGTGSSNLKWAVAIVILTFLRLVLTFLAFADMLGVFGDHNSYSGTMLDLSVISVLYLSLTLPPWVAVLRQGWGEVLRTAGHGLDAGRADTYWRFGTVVVVFWGLILATCIVMCLASDLLISTWKWAQRKLRQTQKPQNKETKEGRDQAPNRDIEKGGDENKISKDA